MPAINIGAPAPAVAKVMIPPVIRTNMTTPMMTVLTNTIIVITLNGHWTFHLQIMLVVAVVLANVVI